MTSTLQAALDQVRRPEYTGENRCTPCTLVNLVVAAVASAALAALWLPAGLALLLAGLASIYLRGYLVPGTPTLTKRYLPDRVLAVFDKHEHDPAGLGAEDATDADAAVDPESYLLSAGAVEPCAGEDDLCLTPAFEAAWRERIEAVRREEGDGAAATAASLADLLDADGEVEFVEHDAGPRSAGGAVVATLDGRHVGQWESRAALVADLAAAEELRSRDRAWTELSVGAQGRVLSGLRVFLERCPACDGPVGIAQEVVESCCRSMDVVEVSCRDCEAPLLEVEYAE